MENLKRLPSVTAKINIEPHEQELGYSNVKVDYEVKNPFRTQIGLNDSGGSSTGKYQNTIGFSYDNLLGLNDMLSVSLNRNINPNLTGFGNIKSFSSNSSKNYYTPNSKAIDGNNGNQLSYSIPFGSYLITSSIQCFNYRQNVLGANQVYLFAGNGQNINVNIEKNIYRSGDTKSSISFGGFLRENNNFIDDLEILVQKRRMGGWELGINHEQSYFPQNVLSGFAKNTFKVGVIFRRGTGLRNSLPAPEQTFNEGTSQFGLININAELSHHFNKEQSFLSEVTLQKSFTPLTPLDRVGMGNRFTVRGFDGQQLLLGDNAIMLRNTFFQDLFQSENLTVKVYGVLDYGKVSGPSTEFLTQKTLVGSVLGLQGVYEKISYDFFIGKPLHQPQLFTSFNEKNNNVNLGFNVQVGF